MADAGADIFILISNRLAGENEIDDMLLDGLDEIMGRSRMKLGLYECPCPHKCLLTERVLRACAESGRSYFLKNTCCGATLIAQHIRWLKGLLMKLFNASTATLLETLLQGAAGFSGVIANFLRGFMHGCGVTRSIPVQIRYRSACVLPPWRHGKLIPCAPSIIRENGKHRPSKASAG